VVKGAELTEVRRLRLLALVSPRAPILPLPSEPVSPLPPESFCLLYLRIQPD